jgi:DGQHR domain-containing protein
MARKLRLKRVSRADDVLEDLAETEHEGRISYTASLITQGDHRFYTLSMPSDVLAETCFIEPRDEEPEQGFQRVLDRRRAEEIAKYIDVGFGTIPTSIVLSAQPEAELEYTRRTRTLRFKKISRAFLILDGQHRVFGFRLATSRLRVPVVIYNNLTRAQECRLFMDINTKQRPVPNELLLDISRLAQTETDLDALFHDIFDMFKNDQTSPLFGLMSPAARKKGRISRVTFNAAMKAIGDAFEDTEPDEAYRALSAYLQSCVAGLRMHEVEANYQSYTISCPDLTLPNDRATSDRPSWERLFRSTF